MIESWQTCMTRVNFLAASRQLSSLVPPVMTIYYNTSNEKAHLIFKATNDTHLSGSKY
jgi:hypothetical protein